MESKHKLRTGVAAGLAALAAMVGVASIASGATGGSTTTPQSGSTPSGYGVPAADSTQQPAASQNGDHPCPKDGSGSGQGAGDSSSQQAAPTTPTAPSTTTTTPDV